MVRLGPSAVDTELSLVENGASIGIIAKCGGVCSRIGYVAKDTGILYLDNRIKGSGLPEGADGSWLHQVY